MLRLGAGVDRTRREIFNDYVKDVKRLYWILTLGYWEDRWVWKDKDYWRD